MRREAFRAKIEKELTSYGYAPGSWIWQANPARFVIAVGGRFQTLPIKATMKKERLAYELGRLKGWAEILGLEPPKPSPKASRQIDIEEAIAGAAA